MYEPNNYADNDIAFFYIWSDKPNLTEEIIKAAEDPKIKKIFFFAQEEWETFQIGLTTIDIESFFSKYNNKKIYVVYGGVKHKLNNRYEVKNSPHFETWPNYFAHVTAHRHIEDDYKLKKPDPEELKKHFICMNGRPHFYRSHFIDEMYGAGFFDYGYISWHEFDIDDYKDKHEWKYWTPQKMEFDNNFHSDNGIADIFIPPDQFTNSVFSIISESNLNCMFFTEKTWIPIYNQKPILIWGHPNSHTFLEQEWGFKLHRNIIDYSFDTEQDDTKRLHMLIEQIKKICLMPINELYKTTLDDAVYNRNLLLDHLKNKTLVPPKIDKICSKHKHQDQIDYYYRVLNIHERLHEART